MTDPTLPTRPVELTRAGQPRLSLPRFLAELADELFSLDRGLPWTLGQLLWRPGWVAQRYIHERDERIVRPIRLLLICLAVATVTAQLSGFSAQAIADLNSDGGAGDRHLDALNQSLHWLTQHFDLWLVLCWIPAVAAALQRAYPGAELNAAEALTSACYSLSLMLVLQLPTLSNQLPELLWPWLLIALAWPVLGAALPLASGAMAWARALLCLVLALLFGAVLLVGLPMLFLLGILLTR